MNPEGLYYLLADRGLPEQISISLFLINTYGLASNIILTAAPDIYEHLPCARP